MWKKRYVGLEEVSQWADLLFYTREWMWNWGKVIHKLPLLSTENRELSTGIGV